MWLNQQWTKAVLVLVGLASAAAESATLDDRARQTGCVNRPTMVVGILYKCETAASDVVYFNVPEVQAAESPPAADGDRWRTVLADSSVTIELDTFRPLGKRPIRKAWLRWSYAKPKESHSFPKYQYESTLNLVFFDCLKRTSATPYELRYDKPAATGAIKSTSGRPIDPPQSAYEETVPDSYGETLLEYVCRAP